MNFTKKDVNKIKRDLKQKEKRLKKALEREMAINELKEMEVNYMKEVVFTKLPAKYKKARQNILIPLEKDIEFIKILSKKYPLKYFLEYKGIPKSSYFHRIHAPTYLERNELEVDMIIEAITNDRFGNSSVAEIKDYIEDRYGRIINHKKIENIVDLLELSKKIKLKKQSTYTGEPDLEIANIINQNFNSTKPYEKLLTDLTFFKFPFGVIVLQPIFDCYSGEILTYVISPSKAFKYTKQLLDQLISKYGEKIKGAILHSDRGSEYKHPVYIYTLKKNGIIQSMSRKATCHDNSPMEAFNGVIKRKIYTKDNRNDYKCYEDFKSAIEEFIILYNNKSRRKLNGYSPIEYRKLWEKEHGNNL